MGCPLPRFLKDKDAFIHGELKALSISLAEKTLRFGTSNHSSIQIEVKKTEDHIDSLIMDALDLKVVHAEQLRHTVSVSRRAASRAR